MRWEGGDGVQVRAMRYRRIVGFRESRKNTKTRKQNYFYTTISPVYDENFFQL